MTPVRVVVVALLLPLGALGCGSDGGAADPRGVIAGPAADVVTEVALAWYPASDDGDALEVLGQVPAAGGSFDVRALLSIEVEPPVRTCEGVAATAQSPGLGVAWIVGVHSVPTSIDLSAPADAADARSDDLVVAFATHDVAPGTPTWSSFEAALPAGLSLMRKRWCDTWTGEVCARIGQEPFCLEPAAPDAVVLLRPL